MFGFSNQTHPGDNFFVEIFNVFATIFNIFINVSIVASLVINS